MPQDSRKQNSNKSYINKYQKQLFVVVATKKVCVDDKFIKPFTFYLAEDAVDNFINSMIEESQYCSEVMKNILTKNF